MLPAELQMLCSDGEHQPGNSLVSHPLGLRLGLIRLSRWGSLPRFSSELSQKGKRDAYYYFKPGYMISSLCNSICFIRGWFLGEMWLLANPSASLLLCCASSLSNDWLSLEREEIAKVGSKDMMGKQAENSGKSSCLNAHCTPMQITCKNQPIRSTLCSGLSGKVSSRLKVHDRDQGAANEGNIQKGLLGE